MARANFFAATALLLFYVLATISETVGTII